MKKKADKKGKSKSPVMKIVLILVIVLTLAVLVAMFYFDIAGIKMSFARAVGIPVMEQAELRQINERIALLDNKDIEIDELGEEIKELKDKLEKSELKVEKLEDSLKDKAEEFALELEGLEEKEKDFISLAKMVEAMEPKKAADMLISLGDREEAVRILNNISGEAAGKIMGAMEAETAASFLEVMVSY